MPGFNGTGPLGQGPLTGRGLGPCGGGMAYGRTGWFGRGFGYGRGFGRGFGYGYYQPTKTEEVSNLKSYIQSLENELKETKNYLKDLETKNSAKK